MKRVLVSAFFLSACVCLVSGTGRLAATAEEAAAPADVVWSAPPAQPQNSQMVLDGGTIFEGENISGAVTNPLSGQAMNLAVTDPFGDLLYVNRIVGYEGEAARFAFRDPGVLTPLLTLTVKAPSVEHTGMVTVLPKRDHFWRGFVVALDRAPRTGAANALACRLLGIDGALSTGYPGSLETARAGLRVLAEGVVSPGVLSLSADTVAAAAAEYESTGDSEALKRRPSLSDGNEITRLATEAGRQIQRLRTLAPAGIVVADNVSVTKENAPLDFSFADADIVGFRTYAASRIRASGAAASAYRPSTARALKEQMSVDSDRMVDLSGWALHREYMDAILAGAIQKISNGAKYASRASTDDGINWSMVATVTGFTGAQEPSAYGGFDWTMLPAACDFAVMSSEVPRWAWSLVRDASGPSFAVVARTGAGTPEAADVIWAAAADGLGGVVLDDAGALVASIAGATGDADEKAPPSALVLDELRAAGADMAAVGTRMATVAIVYSPQSIRAGWMFKFLSMPGVQGASAEEGTRALRAWSAILTDMGFLYEWISMADVASGALARRGYSAVVLPETWCVSQLAAEALYAYATSGGVLIADNGTGFLDENYRAHAKPHLESVFGITRESLSNARAMTILGGAASLSSPADATMKPANAAAGRDAHILSSPVGGGLAMYLNRRVAAYPEAETAVKEAFLAELEPTLRLRRIAPNVALYHGTVEIPVRVNAYRSGRSVVYFLEALAEPAFTPLDKRRLEVRFGVTAHCYDLRAEAPEGEYLGEGGTVNVRMPESGPIVITQTSVMLTGLYVSAQYEARKIYFEAQVGAREPAGDSLLYLEFYGPSGKRAPQFDTRVEAKGGTYLGALVLPQNAPAGTWRIAAREMETGMASWTDVLVR